MDPQELGTGPSFPAAYLIIYSQLNLKRKELCMIYRIIALLLLFAVSALLVAPMPAQAQTTIWSAELTVGYGTGGRVFYGYYHPSFNSSKRRGKLTSNTFTVNSSTFRVYMVQTEPGYFERFQFKFERTSGSRGLEGNSYRLTVGDKTFLVADPRSNKRQFSFYYSGLRWKTGDKISVKLEVLPVLSEATLKNLVLSFLESESLDSETIFSSSKQLRRPPVSSIRTVAKLPVSSRHHFV